MKSVIIIPARLASTRLPNKVLLDIEGLPMIIRVAKQALKSSIKDVFIACGDKEIYDVAKSHNLNAILTDANLPSGTDRIWQAYGKIGKKYDIIINLQGDLPLLDPKNIDDVLEAIKNNNCDIATLANPISLRQEVENPNIVKIAIAFINKTVGNALYFSRSPIPYSKNNDEYYHHIGIYAYRASALEKFVSLKPSVLEKRESLEQLRALENGMKIVVKITNSFPLGVDTKEDLDKVRQILRGNKNNG